VSDDDELDDAAQGQGQELPSRSEENIHRGKKRGRRKGALKAIYLCGVDHKGGEGLLGGVGVLGSLLCLFLCTIAESVR
jgi:hypothetical protein